MEKNLRAFMKQDLKDRGTMEFEGIEAFKDEEGKPIPFVLRRLSNAELREIRNRYRTEKVFRDKKNGGRPVVDDGAVAMIREYDAEKAGLDIFVEAFVFPKLDDPELMEYYDVVDRLDMPRTIFPDADDYRYAMDCVQVACGMKKSEAEKKEIEKIKN